MNDLLVVCKCIACSTFVAIMMWIANISLEVLFWMSCHTSNNEASLDSRALENENTMHVPNWQYIRGKGLYREHLINYCCYFKPKTVVALACTLKLCHMGQ